MKKDELKDWLDHFESVRKWRDAARVQPDGLFAVVPQVLLLLLREVFALRKRVDDIEARGFGGENNT